MGVCGFGSVWLVFGGGNSKMNVVGQEAENAGIGDLSHKSEHDLVRDLSPEDVRDRLGAPR